MVQADLGSGALGSVRVVSGRGLGLKELVHELSEVLADRPRLVLCELSGMDMPADDLGEMFALVADHLLGLPRTVLVVVSADPDARALARELPPAYRLLVAETREAGEVAATALLATLRGAELTLAPDLGSPRAAREFATRAMQDWGLDPMIAPTCLVVSELVTNSVLHAVTSMQLTLTRLDGHLLVAVRDLADGLPEHRQPPAEQGLNGRGLVLVQAFALDWGVLPASSGGKTVWALLADEDVEPADQRVASPTES